jgi:predicted PurR-regulated permease PerM
MIHRAVAEAPGARLTDVQPIQRPNSSQNQAGTSIAARLLMLIALAVGLAVISLGSELLIPITAAVLLAFLLRPLVRLLRRVGVNEVVGAALVTVGAFAVLGLLLSQLLAPAMMWVERAPEAARRLENLASGLRGPMERITQATEEVQQMAELGDGPLAIPVEVRADPLSDRALGGAMASVLGSVAVVLLLFFMLAYGERALRSFTAAIRTPHHRRHLRVILCRLERDFGRYLLTITVINLGLGAVETVAMWLLGMPNPFLWGGLAAVLNFIPYLGSVVGALAVGMVALLTYPDPMMALLPPLTYFSITAIEGYLVTPMVLGYRFRINPLVVMLAIVVWGWLWGIPGALFAVPLLVAIQIACARLPVAGPLLCAMSSAPADCQSEQEPVPALPRSLRPRHGHP